MKKYTALIKNINIQQLSILSSANFFCSLFAKPDKKNIRDGFTYEQFTYVTEISLLKLAKLIRSFFTVFNQGNYTEVPGFQ